MALVIDRMFLIVYLSTVFIGTLIIVFEAPLASVFFKSFFMSSDQDGEFLQTTNIVNVIETNVPNKDLPV